MHVNTNKKPKKLDSLKRPIQGSPPMTPRTSRIPTYPFSHRGRDVQDDVSVSLKEKNRKRSIGIDNPEFSLPPVYFCKTLQNKNPTSIAVQTDFSYLEEKKRSVDSFLSTKLKCYEHFKNYEQHHEIGKYDLNMLKESVSVTKVDREKKPKYDTTYKKKINIAKQIPIWIKKKDSKYHETCSDKYDSKKTNSYEKDYSSSVQESKKPSVSFNNNVEENYFEKNTDEISQCNLRPEVIKSKSDTLINVSHNLSGVILYETVARELSIKHKMPFPRLNIKSDQLVSSSNNKIGDKASSIGSTIPSTIFPMEQKTTDTRSDSKKSTSNRIVKEKSSESFFEYTGMKAIPETSFCSEENSEYADKTSLIFSQSLNKKASYSDQSLSTKARRSLKKTSLETSASSLRDCAISISNFNNSKMSNSHIVHKKSNETVPDSDFHLTDCESYQEIKTPSAVKISLDISPKNLEAPKIPNDHENSLRYTLFRGITLKTVSNLSNASKTPMPQKKSSSPFEQGDDKTFTQNILTKGCIVCGHCTPEVETLGTQTLETRMLTSADILKLCNSQYKY